jgi:hypothetical protein
MQRALLADLTALQGKTKPNDERWWHNLEWRPHLQHFAITHAFLL